MVTEHHLNPIVDQLAVRVGVEGDKCPGSVRSNLDIGAVAHWGDYLEEANGKVFPLLTADDGGCGEV